MGRNKEILLGQKFKKKSRKNYLVSVRTGLFAGIGRGT